MFPEWQSTHFLSNTHPAAVLEHETSCPADDGVIEVEPFAQLQRLGAWGYYHLTAGEGRSCLAKGIHWWLQWWCPRLR